MKEGREEGRGYVEERREGKERKARRRKNRTKLNHC